MKIEDKIKVLAELDGWIEVDDFLPLMGISPHAQKRGADCRAKIPDYFNSYDVTIPLIQKQDSDTRFQIAKLISFNDNYWSIGVLASCESLCDALIKATGKWKD